MGSKKATINVENQDEECFKYAVLAALERRLPNSAGERMYSDKDAGIQQPHRTSALRCRRRRCFSNRLRSEREISASACPVVGREFEREFEQECPLESRVGCLLESEVGFLDSPEPEPEPCLAVVIYCREWSGMAMSWRLWTVETVRPDLVSEVASAKAPGLVS